MLNAIKDKIFEEPNFQIILSYQRQDSQTIKQLLHSYHVAEAKEPTKDNPCNIQIP